MISFGAILGANFRFIIYKKLQNINFSKTSIILLINTSSSFLFGAYVSILNHISSFSYSYQVGLLFTIGLLGSLSTFSAFIYDLYCLFILLKVKSALRLFIVSISSGVLAFSLGFFLSS